MSQSAPDVHGLAEQLADGGVAFGTDNPANVPLRGDLETALADVALTATGRTGVIVLEQTGQPTGQLRDLAQDTQALTDLDTVIVRTPASTAAVSDTLTRAQVEKGQYALISEPEYAAGIRAFGAESEGFSVPWGLVAGTLVVLIGIAAVASVATFRAGVKHSD